LSAAEKAEIEDKFVNQRLFSSLGVADKTYLKEVLDLPTTVVANAKAKPGSFPLILFVNREYRGIHSNSVLMEYLASHGYVVATTASKDRTKSYQTGMSDEVLIQANIEDIQYVKDYMQSFDNIDQDKTGVIGYFVGSVAAPLLAQNDQSIGAIVNLQSLLNTDFFGKANLEKFKYFNPQQLQTPILDFWQPFDVNKVDEPRFYNAVKYADAYNYQMSPDFDSLAFSSHFNLAWVKSTDKKTAEQKRTIDGFYATVNQYSLNFFDAYLKDDNHAKHSLTKTPANNAFSVVARPALPAPPSEQQFVSIINQQGASAAIKRYHKFAQANAELQILSGSGTLNNVGYGALGEGKVDQAIELFAFNVSLFPDEAGIQDSLAEAYKAKGDTTRAIIEYKKVLEKKPSQFLKDNSVKMLKEMGVEL
jgi:tetratricopeptide (TPR) repeat protein